MKLFRFILVAGLILLFFGINSIQGEEKDFAAIPIQDLFLFDSSEEIYRTIKEFAKEELGMSLRWEIPEDENKTVSASKNTIGYFYSVEVCHKLRFWDENMPLCSLYVYGRNFPPSTRFIERYDTTDYDIRSSRLPRYRIALGDEQKIPTIELTESLDSFIDKLDVIFHEGFHNHVERNGPVDRRVCVTIKNRTLEESAANIVGIQSAQLFINKYGVDERLIECAQEKLDGGFYHRKIARYNQLSAIYSSDLPDSVKIIEKGEENNANLSLWYLYSRYYDLFEELWQTTNDPGKSIYLLLQIINNNTMQLETIN